MDNDTDDLMCAHCGSHDLELIEEVLDGDLRIQAYECRDCGKFSYREV